MSFNKNRRNRSSTIFLCESPDREREKLMKYLTYQVSVTFFGLSSLLLSSFIAGRVAAYMFR
jgi:hypothetical protein